MHRFRLGGVAGDVTHAFAHLRCCAGAVVAWVLYVSTCVNLPGQLVGVGERADKLELAG